MRNIKKPVAILIALGITLVCLTALSSCTAKEGKETTLYVYNWGEYMADGSEGSMDVNKAFEEYYEKTFGEKVKVNYSTFSSNEDLYAKISSGTVSYDVICPSDYMIQRLRDEDYLAKLNYENIPHVSNLSPDFYGESAIYDYYDEGNLYSVPYLYGMIGIIYNKTMVAEADIGSWELMWNEKYKGNILQFNNPRDAFGTAQYKLKIDVNTATEAEWRLALEELKAQKNIVQGYVMDEVFNKMENGSAAIAAYYAGDYLSMYENNPDLEFFYPEEGTNLYIDAMCVPKASKNKVIAERYIDFLLQKEAAIENAQYTYYATPNLAARNDEGYKAYMADIKPDAYEKMYADNVNATPYKSLTEEKQAILNSLWEELKADIEIGISIYIICGIILTSLLAIFITYTVKKRSKRKLYDNP